MVETEVTLATNCQYINYFIIIIIIIMYEHIYNVYTPFLSAPAGIAEKETYWLRGE